MHNRRKGKPDEDRVERVYAALYGDRGRYAWDPQKRNTAQQIIYIEDACKSILEGIKEVEGIKDINKVGPSLDALRADFHFLKTLINEKSFLRSFDFLTRD